MIERDDKEYCGFVCVFDAINGNAREIRQKVIVMTYRKCLAERS